MKLIYALGALGVAHCATMGFGAKFEGQVLTWEDANRRARSLQQGGDSCSSSAQTKVEAIRPWCDARLQEIGTVQWTPCCTFGDEGDMCRTFETSGQYCDMSEASNDNCDGLGTTDILSFYLTFGTTRESCCQQCTCYGDPECISFGGAMDLWIPCDARKLEDCRMYEDRCDSLTDPNGNACQWNSQKINSQGWNIAIDGSPCVPDLSEEISMTMWESKNGQFKLNLALGERGVITKTTFKMGSKTYALTSQDCFAKSGAAAWGETSIPSSWTEVRDPSGEMVRWVVYDSNTKTRADMTCMRHVQKGQNGLPRINVENLFVKDASISGSKGFCATGSISEKADTPENEFSTTLHKECVMDVTDSLQACKNLVSAGVSGTDLEYCANLYCDIAAVNDANQCKKGMGDGARTNRWKEYYCEALKNLGEITDSNECQKMVSAQGWSESVKMWGQGHLDTVSERACGNSVADYKLEFKQACDDGVYIEALINGVWTPQYFIPNYKPPCNGRLDINAKQNKNLFTNSVRVKQCDVMADGTCASVDSCSSSVSADFKLVFTNTPRQLTQLYNDKMLCCSPNDSGSTTWCLPGSPDYVPVQEVCPCDAERGAGRLLDLLHGISVADKKH